MSRLDLLREKIISGFFGFWINKYRLSYLFILGIIVIGLFSVINIPKESSPSVKFGMINIITVYPGTNPNDIDSLITQKIYKEIKDIKGIDKISSNSSLGVSNVVVTLKTGVYIKDVVNEVRNNVNRIILPEDAETPIINEVDTDTKQIFSIYLYSKNKNISKELLINKAQILKDSIEKLSTIESVIFANGSLRADEGSKPTNGNEYDIEIIVNPEKLKSSGLSIDYIASVIKSWNLDIPIGNFSVGDKKYDFRIEGKYKDEMKILDIPIQLQNGKFIKLKDIVTIEKIYKDKTISLVGIDGSNTYPYVSLVVNKMEGVSIFGVSNETKKIVNELFLTNDFKDFEYIYGNDISDMIIDEYKELLREALLTLVLVFITMYLFVGFKDSIFATIALPLAFLSTFILLYILGFTLNFLTNFSLILSFGIAIDTIIVIVQAASSKIRIGYNPETAIMLALSEYSIPIISGVMTTIVAFIPMIFLPGLLGKFLAYIPITIFGVLAFGLILALTVNSALYLLFVKKQNKYVNDDSVLEYATEEEKELLLLEREGKEKMDLLNTSIRIKIINISVKGYKLILSKFLQNTIIRRISIVIPVILFVISFIFLAPKIGVEIFPSTDEDYLSIYIEGEKGLRTEKMYEKIVDLNILLSKYKEINYYSIQVNENNVTVSIQLHKKKQRDTEGLMNVFNLERKIAEDIGIFENNGLKVAVKALESGPPGGKAVGLKLIAEKTENLNELIYVSKVFESYLKTISGIKNSGLSSKDTPGQFIISLKKENLATYNIPPSIVYTYIIQMMNGITVGSIEDNGSDMDMIVKQSNFRDIINIEDVLNANFSYMGKNYQVGNFVDFSTSSSIASISREDGKITITVDADIEKGVDTVSTQAKFEEFAKKYAFPTGISYEKGGENEENKELIIALLTSFFIALLIIFSILTLQFNSYSQPIMVLYSVVMSLPLVMFGLLITGNSFSLPFGIGFIAFTGIAVNHGIILIDAINQNLNKGMTSFTALIEAGSSRLEPMMLTTFTTIFGILPIALKDEFWSGMGFTIIFGIISASLLTLFVLKGLYYEIYLRKSK